MKINVILKTAAMIGLAIMALAWNLFAQSVTSVSQTDSQASAAQSLSVYTARLKAASALSKAQAQVESDPALLAIFPPGYFDQLQGMADGTLSPDMFMASDTMTPNGHNPVPADQTPVGQNYTVVDLGAVGSDLASYAYGINNNGQTVGDSLTASGGTGHAFLYSNGSMQGLVTPYGFGSIANGINNSGQVVGYAYYGNGTFSFHAFLYSDGSMQDLGTLPGGTYSSANGINNHSQVVGYSSATNGGYIRAFLYSNGSMQDLGAFADDDISLAYGINDNGQVVGYSDIGIHSHAFLYSNGSMQDLGTLPGSGDSYAYGVNNNGQVVGDSFVGNNYHAFLYSDGSMQDLGMLPGGSFSVAFGINDNGQVVGYADSSNNGSAAFLYSGGVMQDLNSLLINPNSGWTLQAATAINNAGQIVGSGINPSGQTHAFLLNPLPLGSVTAASTVQTNLPPYSDPPAPAVTGLVFITHGWIDSKEFPATLPEAINFVNQASNVVAQYLANNGIQNWQVCGYQWTNQADYTLFQGGPTTALGNAEQIGVKLGNYIVAQGSSGWTHIHFIAHSAGAGMIQRATEVIKTSLGTNVTIHCTFLDAYDGLAGEKAYEYGSQADWADSYFVRDGFQLAGVTGRLLPNAYNVDVTALDQSSSLSPWYESPIDPIPTCRELQSNHGWPIWFYSNSIAGNLSSVTNGLYYDGFGFPLSEEGGQWNYALNNYLPGNGLSYGSVADLGPERGCVPAYGPPPGYIGTVPNFLMASSTIQSITGSVLKFIGSIIPGTGSPVWAATVITDTNALNYVSFDAEFTSASGANGLLTVYWDTNLIGEVEEAAVEPGLQHYNFSFPNTVPNTSHVLGFHIDPFTAVHSSMVLTNIVTGSVGVSLPPVLTVTTNTSNGLLVYQLTGQPGTYTVQSSEDLSNWTDMAILANTNGTVIFADQDSTNYPCRFYRATAPTGLTQ